MHVDFTKVNALTLVLLLKIFDRSGDRVPLLCIDKHPTQPHLIVTGGQDGVLGLWDMRQERYPVTLLEAHSAESMTIFCGIFPVADSLVYN